MHIVTIYPEFVFFENITRNVCKFLGFIVSLQRCSKEK